MSARPILFQPAMVRALLAGTKTQTRRVIRDQKLYRQAADGVDVWTGFMGWQALEWALENRQLCAKGCLPASAVGDLLWVREAWAPLAALTHNDPGTRALIDRGFYRADEGTTPGEIASWRPSIHMPRWASRLTLVVTDVRVQRLQEISEDDAWTEGIEPDDTGTAWLCYAPQPKGQTHWADPRESYRTLWDSINGTGSWGANPWVAAYTFSVHRQNVDNFLADQARVA